MVGYKNRSFMLVAVLFALVALGYSLYVSTMLISFGPAIFGNGFSGILKACVHDGARSDCVHNVLVTIIGFSLGTVGVIGKETGYFRRDTENQFSELAENFRLTGGSNVYGHDGIELYQIESAEQLTKESGVKKLLEQYYTDPDVVFHLNTHDSNGDYAGDIVHQYHAESDKHMVKLDFSKLIQRSGKREDGVTDAGDNQLVSIWSHTTPGYAGQHAIKGIESQVAWDVYGDMAEHNADSICYDINTDFRGRIMTVNDDSEKWVRNDCYSDDNLYNSNRVTHTYGHDELK